MTYTANVDRYTNIPYRRCGNSGLLLPTVSLGLWHNFSSLDDEAVYRKTLHTAFDNGITHFDLANNYGPPPGSAEENFGKIFHEDFKTHRDEIIISTKAGYSMWPGPYGEWGSKKHLISSLHQSLKRMNLEYVDIFYHHRPDPNTPLEESMSALDLMVRQGKALYVGISSYSASETLAAIKILQQLGTPCIIHQPKYNMLDRWVEKADEAINKNLLQVLQDNGVGSIVFSPLAQGLLTDKYLKGIPENSRVGRNLPNGALTHDGITEVNLKKVSALNGMAKQRNQSLAQMAIAWLLKDARVTSVLVGASSSTQLLNSIDAVKNIVFTAEELKMVEEVLTGNATF
jgi:L-glyceraldehyde 3-phosphate reductase